MFDDVLKAAEHKMTRAVEVFVHDLQGVRTGRATPSLLDRVQVDYYGTPTPINAVANISAPEPRMVTVQPWERSMLSVIEKAIQKSDIGVNPTNDGQILRIVLPQLTEDRRRDLVKQVHARAEESRVAVRNCRRDAMDQLKKADHDGQTSEGEVRRAQEKLQKLTDQYVHKIDDVTKRKEAEVMEV